MPRPQTANNGRQVDNDQPWEPQRCGSGEWAMLKRALTGVFAGARLPPGRLPLMPITPALTNWQGMQSLFNPPGWDCINGNSSRRLPKESLLSPTPILGICSLLSLVQDADDGNTLKSGAHGGRRIALGIGLRPVMYLYISIARIANSPRGSINNRSCLSLANILSPKKLTESVTTSRTALFNSRVCVTFRDSTIKIA
ncbi:hypothetical protein CLAIMM_03201 [Cladophialophora immunda]|nr:hypothetical protein CLAIMM_03201 [Cladophialophora immunda]